MPVTVLLSRDAVISFDLLSWCVNVAFPGHTHLFLKLVTSNTCRTLRTTRPFAAFIFSIISIL